MHPPDAAVLARKASLRRIARERRLALAPAWHAEASRAAAWQALRALPWRERRRVALFWPHAGEVDTRPLLHALFWLGALPLLPRMQGRGQPLVFAAWTPDTALAGGPFGVMEPPADQPAAVPDIILVPLLAFDREGRRLGYGAGFYDRTLAALAAENHQALRAGFAFASQEVDMVPTDAHDAPLDLVVTEAGVLGPFSAAPASMIAEMSGP